MISSIAGRVVPGSRRLLKSHETGDAAMEPSGVVLLKTVEKVERVGADQTQGLEGFKPTEDMSPTISFRVPLASPVIPV